jgi:hypothetical protein
MSHAKTLTDIVHVRQVSTTAQKGADTDVTSLLTAAQQAKVAEIDALLIEVGEPTVDEELDAIIVALTEIRDRP